MKYELSFHKKALKEWNKISPDIRSQFKNKLKERLNNPRVISAKLRGTSDCYKIKLKNVGYRLVYKVEDDKLLILILAVGKRDNNEAYNNFLKRVS